MKLLLLLWAFLAPGGYVPAMLALTGASCVEELSESEIERWQSLYEHPLDLNLAGRSRLLSCGLFTPYQVASILDVRSRSGDILSITELGLTDGFTPETAAALSCFVVLRSNSAPGSRRSLPRSPSRLPSQSLTLRGSGKTSLTGSPSLAAGLKYEICYGERAALYWSSRTTYSDTRFGLGTLSAVYYGRRHLGKVVLGNFNARFGQGLAQWSGFDMSSLSSVAAFRKRGGGLSPSGSYSAELCGVAADFNFGHWSVSGAYSFSGNEIIANVLRVGRVSSYGLTATRSRASLDWRIGFPNLSFFGEAALSCNFASAAKAGLIWIPSYGRKLALLARWFDPRWSRDYSGLALGAELPHFSAIFDSGYSFARQKSQFKGTLSVFSATLLGDLALCTKFRFRPDDDLPNRIDTRLDWKKVFDPWMVAGRINTLWCRGFAWLWYLEGGYEREKFSAYARAGLFKVDNWDDRIYVYERDAPGSFNVPAIYGRGWNASAYLAWKPSRTHSFWLRLETTNYPWNLSPKDPKLELKLQYRLRL